MIITCVCSAHFSSKIKLIHRHWIISAIVPSSAQIGTLTNDSPRTVCKIHSTLYLTCIDPYWKDINGTDIIQSVLLKCTPKVVTATNEWVCGTVLRYEWMNADLQCEVLWVVEMSRTIWMQSISHSSASVWGFNRTQWPHWKVTVMREINMETKVCLPSQVFGKPQRKAARIISFRQWDDVEGSACKLYSAI